jgi:hypothetical protein
MEIKVPQYIQLENDHWALAEFLTVALWREAKRAAVKGNDKHTLLQFRWATLLLEKAEQRGIPEDVCLLPWLEEGKEVKPPWPPSDASKQPKPELRLVDSTDTEPHEH